MTGKLLLLRSSSKHENDDDLEKWRDAARKRNHGVAEGLQPDRGGRNNGNTRFPHLRQLLAIRSQA